MRKDCCCHDRVVVIPRLKEKNPLKRFQRRQHLDRIPVRDQDRIHVRDPVPVRDRVPYRNHGPTPIIVTFVKTTKIRM